MRFYMRVKKHPTSFFIIRAWIVTRTLRPFAPRIFLIRSYAIANTYVVPYDTGSDTIPGTP